mmetsp:Transcript_11785/g.14307  ORF Transcript_11785/g.14307 Transcript_11785/m.14307 type:complete len:277 (+) Transcript_11785:288-1118(+)|eukprot:CAMPEP_0184008134 /NCGR_PEP_ID=MMETSP0954-20121128/1775_1 /TAXON_ID=627963 /ORGANISM="Aplanochytrium sp, Strain PBS07" /LENGTH=276 /DNA_ID=CAMNT_0026287151 /DNA_START=255 /DNA_END=1085 /DNA_ORIENTATION=-
MNVLNQNIFTVPQVQAAEAPRQVKTIPQVLEKRQEKQSYEAEDEQIRDDTEDEASDELSFDGVEVIPGVFVGGETCAGDTSGRTSRGITHVLSVYMEFEERYKAKEELVKANRWKTIRLEDAADSNLLDVFSIANEFIKNALQNSGKVVIHSLEGFSRSSSICIGYMMMEKQMTLLQASEHMKNLRAININRGFWRQLHALDILLNGKESIPEADLPGAIIFEKEAIQSIVDDFKHKFQLESQGRKRRTNQDSSQKPKSPRTSGRIRKPTQRLFFD